jgi:ABC-type multidrug transport system fused ATPase/permease subunit
MPMPPKPPKPSYRERLVLTVQLLKHLPRTVRLVWVSSGWLLPALILTMSAMALIGPAAAWVGKLIVDGVSVSARSGLEADRQKVIYWVAVELGLMFATMVLTRLNVLERQLVGARLGNYLNELILEKALTLELRHFEDAAFYDKMQNARREASQRPLNMVMQVFTVLQSVLTLSTYAVMLSRLSWWSVLVIAAASLPSFIVEARLSGDSFRLNSWRAPEARRQAYYEWLLTRDNHVKEVKLFGLGPLIMSRYRALFAKFYAEDRKLALRRTGYGILLGMVSLAAFYGSYALMAAKAAMATVSLGDLTLYLNVFRQGQDSVSGILYSIAGLYEDGLFMGNLFTYLDIETKGEASRLAVPLALPTGSQAIEFHDVSYRYEGKDAWALRHITLRIAPGEKIALCGDNGAGKSTLIKLLLRLYEPTEGFITYGGVDLRDINPDDFRKRIGVVFQDFVRYQFNVADNIGLGQVEALEDRARIEAAAERGGALPVILKLPQGFETMLGGWFEEGQELSGGQWQKIAIARAFMRDAEVLILDEPTAALDAEAEHDLFLRLKALAADKSAILISHRFSTVRMADQIAVMQDGQITELGSHSQLMAKAGRYAHLFTLQAQGYVEDAARG